MTRLRPAIALSLLLQALPSAALEGLPSLPTARPVRPPATGLALGPSPSPLPPLPTLPIPLPPVAGLPSPLTSLPAVIPATLPVVVPSSAGCQFNTPQATLAFGAVPTGVLAETYAQPLLLQVECRQAAEFSFSTMAPVITSDNAAERSSLVVTLRGPDGSIQGTAWVRLEQEGQPLATRRFSVPAASPTLIAMTAVLVAHPTSTRTPERSGSLESLVLAHQLHLMDGSAP